MYPNRQNDFKRAELLVPITNGGSFFYTGAAFPVCSCHASKRLLPCTRPPPPFFYLLALILWLKTNREYALDKAAVFRERRSGGRWHDALRAQLHAGRSSQNLNRFFLSATAGSDIPRRRETRRF